MRFIFTKRLPLIICTIICLLSLAEGVFACACCSEPGTYRLWTGKPNEYQMSLLEEIKYDQAAYLFMTDAGFDGIKGLDNIAKSYDSNNWVASPEYFSLSNVFAAKTWKFNFKTKDGKAGTLVLPMPAQMLSYVVDTHESDDEELGNGPVLYKEWRFKGNVQTGSGFFQPSVIRPTTYFLVLQGRGNNCDNAFDFTHWRLEISGRKADYAFFGKLSSGGEPKEEPAMPVN
jgi:hypothetical protein